MSRAAGAAGGRPLEAKLTQRAFLSWPLPALRLDPAELRVPKMTRSREPQEADAADPFREVGRVVSAAKAKLDPIPKDDFTRLMGALDLYSGLKGTLRSRYNMTSPTNATLKILELITQMRLLGGGPVARVFCNAELPGAFIVAINHYVKTMLPQTELDWIASSYYPPAAAAGPAHAPSDTSIFGDQYGIYARHRDRWLMGPKPNAMPAGAAPVNGDLTDPAVVAALGAAVHARFAAAPGEPPRASGATLYTSDAGIDVVGVFNLQEELTSALNFGQVVCGLLALAPGGALVTKQYTFVTPFSRSLIAVMAALFDEVAVTKPRASRPVNSEVYIVGRGFRGIDPAFAAALLDRLAAYQREARKPVAERTTPCDWAPLLDPTVYADVDATLLRVARQVHGRQQVAFLEEAVAFYGAYRGRNGPLRDALHGDARRVQEAWLAANPIRRIRDDQKLEATLPPRDPGRTAPG